MQKHCSGNAFFLALHNTSPVLSSTLRPAARLLQQKKNGERSRSAARLYTVRGLPHGTTPGKAHRRTSYGRRIDSCPRPSTAWLIIRKSRHLTESNHGKFGFVTISRICRLTSQTPNLMEADSGPDLEKLVG